VNPRRIVTGLLVAAVVVAAYLLISGGDEGYTIKAELPNAGGVKPHSSVKIAGVPGGTVEKLEITPRDTALVTMKLKDNAAPIGKDASIQIRPTDLLGERYIALDAGNVNDPAPKNFEIPKSRTKLPVELDDVLNTFDADTRTRIKILVNEFGVALGNRGKDLASLLNEMPSTLGDARQLVTEITDESASLKTLLARGDSLTASIDPKKDQLASLVTQADATLKALADRRDKIGRTLDAAPGGLAALNTTLTQLRQASTDLRPASVDLKNAAGPLKDTLDALPGFEQSARESLKAAKTAAPAVTKLGNKATGPLKTLTPTLANLEQFSGDLKPTLDVFDNRAFEDAMWFAQNLGGLGLKGRDGLGHTLGALATVNTETVRAVTNYLFNGGAAPDGLVDGGAVTKSTSSKSTTQSKSAPRTTAPSPSTSAPAPTTSAPTTTGSSPAPQTQDKGLLGGLVDGVSGLLGGNAGTNSKPGAEGGVAGLLNSLLKP
jgi:virulence factor Mce-like protein